MMFVDFQQEGRPVPRCSLGAGPGPETYSSSWSEIAPRPDGPYKQPGWDRRSGPKEGVHNVHTLGFGSGRTGSGLGRIAEVSGERRIFKGRNPVRVPPRARVFRFGGLWASESAQGFSDGLGAHACWWPLLWRVAPRGGSGSGVATHSFKAVSA